MPYLKTNEADTAVRKSVSKDIAYFLPDNLDLTSSVNPREKQRGIFKVMLYDSKVSISGSFNGLSFGKLNIAADQFIWNEAFVMMQYRRQQGAE